jgi:ubiquinone/menaquinone biosynthesis C-methylase UbiE
MQSLTATLAGRRLQGRRAFAKPAPRRVQYVSLRCPECKGNLAPMAYHELGQTQEAIECRECFAVMAQERGIWVALAKNREKHFEEFIQNYEAVRKAEARGSEDPQFYLSLPYRDRTERNSWQWTIRARTYRYIERKLLPEIKQHGSQALSVLDLGAGNGWLSYRLASLGHQPIAIDLQTNAFDGLGAAIHYQHALPMFFPRFRAELDRLPFATRQFDCAIFNASFHYSENYDTTLAEAVRCVRVGGTVVIADSPFYTRDECGQQMLRERRKFFQQQFGFPSDSLASREYLTPESLAALETRHSVQWKTHDVWYGLRWACRPLVASVRRKREPSKFRIYTGQVGP